MNMDIDLYLDLEITHKKSGCEKSLIEYCEWTWKSYKDDGATACQSLIYFAASVLVDGNSPS